MEGFTKRQEQRRGFNLIESAVVLGLVGLVVGGVWWAASAVSERQKINDLVSGVILGADKLRNLVTPAAIDASPGIYYRYLNDICTSANIFPSFPIKNGKIQNPFGSQISGYDSRENGSGIHCAAVPSPYYVIINIVVPTKGICQKVLSEISSKFRGNSELNNIRVKGADWTETNITSYPVAPEGIECSGKKEPIQIRLYYTVKRMRP
jgi:hypothetical protein